MNTHWLNLYKETIIKVATAFKLPQLRLAALIWQESNGGIDFKTAVWRPDLLYRYEPAFYARYLAKNPKYAVPAGVMPQSWAARVSASYGVAQVMYPTAVDMGYTGNPEGLFDPEASLWYGAKLLAKVLAEESNSWPKALLRYNGGSNKQYPIESEAKYQDLLKDPEITEMFK